MKTACVAIFCVCASVTSHSVVVSPHVAIAPRVVVSPRPATPPAKVTQQIHMTPVFVPPAIPHITASQPKRDK